MTWNDIKNLYRSWAVEHPYWAGVLVVAESAAIGTVTDLVFNGVDFSKNGLKHAAVIIGVAVVNAVRNYLRTAPKDLAASLQPK